MSTKEEFEDKLEKSFQDLKTSIFGAKLSKNEVEARIMKILERETKDIILITQLKYLEGYSIPEISFITNKTEFQVCAYLDYIISRINSILWNEKKDIKTANPNSSGNILDIKG